MDKDKFNIEMNTCFIFELEKLSTDISDIADRIKELSIKLDRFKERCLLDMLQTKEKK